MTTPEHSIRLTKIYDGQAEYELICHHPNRSEFSTEDGGGCWFAEYHWPDFSDNIDLITPIDIPVSEHQYNTDRAAVVVPCWDTYEADPSVRLRRQTKEVAA